MLEGAREGGVRVRPAVDVAVVRETQTFTFAMG